MLALVEAAEAFLHAGVRLNVRRYRRKFCAPLRTAHGTWSAREGLLVKVEGRDGRVGFGEIASLPDFGTETVDAAEALLRSESFSVRSAEVPPCTRSALCAAALMAVAESGTFAPVPAREVQVAALLPSGEAALESLAGLLAGGWRTFKWKIGVGDVDAERAVFRSLCAALPGGARLRLDANGGLEADLALGWLKACEGKPVEFLEQPLKPGREAEMASLGGAFSTPVALDESVAGLGELQRAAASGWAGPLVVKPGLLGDLFGFLRWRGSCPCPLVYSSALETALGIELALCLASTDVEAAWAAGLGTAALFERDGMNLHPQGPCLAPGALCPRDWEALWRG